MIDRYDLELLSDGFHHIVPSQIGQYDLDTAKRKCRGINSLHTSVSILYIEDIDNLDNPIIGIFSRFDESGTPIYLEPQGDSKDSVNIFSSDYRIIESNSDKYFSTYKNLQNYLPHSAVLKTKTIELTDVPADCMIHLL